MAYMGQEKKKMLLPAIKLVLKKYKVKASVSVQNHSSLVLNVKSSNIDFIGNWCERPKLGSQNKSTRPSYIAVNQYYANEQFTGTAKKFVIEMIDAMNGTGTDDPNFDKSDIQSDYFHIGWYIDINIGQWDKPYILQEA